MSHLCKEAGACRFFLLGIGVLPHELPSMLCLVGLHKGGLCSLGRDYTAAGPTTDALRRIHVRWADQKC